MTVRTAESSTDERIKFACCACLTRNGEAPVLAAHARLQPAPAWALSQSDAERTRSLLPQVEDVHRAGDARIEAVDRAQDLDRLRRVVQHVARECRPVCTRAGWQASTR